MSEKDPAWLSTSEIEKRVSTRELDLQAVVRAHLDAIDRLDSRIHAYVFVDRNARAAAGPLSGITLAVKDNLPVAGMPWTDGSAVWADRVPDYDTVPVARVRAAGAAVLGKTNLPELAAAVGTTNAIYPATNNPWLAGITPGGSTGGSAAAVSAGMATVGMGTDMGGSIRIPASCCGIVGLRPSPDRVRSEISDPAGLSVIAPLGRSVADVKMLYSLMAEPAPYLPPMTNGMRVGAVDSTALGVHPACADACRRAAGALESLGHRVEHVAWESEVVATGYGVVRRASMASFPADPRLFAPGIRKLVEQGRALSALDYFQAFESATGAGKASLLWGLVRAMFPLLQTGLVRVLAADPKLMELAYGRAIFESYGAYAADPAAIAAMLDQAVADMQDRAGRFAGRQRDHAPTTEDPFTVVLVDEVAFLTAYQPDRKLKERIMAALATLTTQGRAVGYCVVAALQDPRKDVLTIRNLFPDRIAMRLDEPEQVDMVLGDGARDRGATCELIASDPATGAGVAFVRLEADPDPVRVRAGWVSDPDIRALAAACQPELAEPIGWPEVAA